MKKIFIMLTLVSSVLFASNGEEVFKKRCIACHKMDGKMDDKHMRAPSMKMVSMRVKKMTADQKAFVAFVEDYIQNPSKKKGFCMPMAYKRFGTMPPIGKSMSAKNRKAVALWLHDSFTGSWDKAMGGMMCKKKNAKMKCGGNAKSNMKCGSKTGSSTKCGGTEAQTAGKCGSK